MKEVVRNQKGIVLLIALVVVAVLAALVIEFGYAGRVDTSISRNQWNAIRAHWLAKSGVNLAIWCLDRDGPGSDSFHDDWMDFSSPFPLGEGTLVLDIRDGERHLGLNHLLTNEGIIDEERVEELERLLGEFEVEREFLPSLLDWLDSDSASRSLGAEDPYYQSLANSYPCKDGPLDTEKELLLIKGMDEGSYYGDEEERGLGEFVTVYSSGLVNVNTAPLEVLASLSEGMTQEVGQRIEARRAESPLQNLSDLKEVQGISSSLYQVLAPRLTVRSTFFRVTAKAEVRETAAWVTAVLERREGKIDIIYWESGIGIRETER